MIAETGGSPSTRPAPLVLMMAGQKGSNEMKKSDPVDTLYNKVFDLPNPSQNVNKWLKAVIVNFDDERGDLIVTNDNFGTRRKYANFTEGRKAAGLHPMQIVFSGVEMEHLTGGRYINQHDEICKF